MNGEFENRSENVRRLPVRAAREKNDVCVYVRAFVRKRIG